MHLITGCVLNPFTVAQFLVTSVRHNGSNTGFKNGYVTEGDVVFLRPSRQMTCYYITVGHGRFLLLLFNSLFTDLYVTRRYEYSDKRRPYINHTQINRRKVGLSVYLSFTAAPGFPCAVRRPAADGSPLSRRTQGSQSSAQASHSSLVTIFSLLSQANVLYAQGPYSLTYPAISQFCDGPMLTQPATGPCLEAVLPASISEPVS